MKQLVSDQWAQFVETHPRPENPPPPPPDSNEAKTGSDDLLRFLRG